MKKTITIILFISVIFAGAIELATDYSSRNQSSAKICQVLMPVSLNQTEQESWDKMCITGYQGIAENGSYCWRQYEIGNRYRYHVHISEYNSDATAESGSVTIWFHEKSYIRLGDVLAHVNMQNLIGEISYIRNNIFVFRFETGEYIIARNGNKRSLLHTPVNSIFFKSIDSFESYKERACFE